ncbi:unnamed protein product [Calypogeia fissa]
MQRFVALSSSSSHHASSSLVLPPVPAWKGRDARDGHRAAASLRPAELGRGWNHNTTHKKNNSYFSIVLPLIRGENFCVVPCCHQGCCSGGGPPPRRNISSLPGLVDGTRGRLHGLRTRSVSRGSLGNRQGGPNSADERGPLQHRGQQRSHPHVVDSIREFSSDSWWTDNDGGDDSEEDEGAALSVELWTSQIILQLSLFWNLLGYSPSKVDEWLVSNEARRRLNSLNNRNRRGSRFTSAISSSFLPVPSSPLGDPSKGDSSVANSAGGFSEFLSIALPSFRPSERLSEAMGGLKTLLYPQWLAEMSRTYGASFMLLVALGYATQGFRCFPWFAVGYMLKDGLQVDPGYMQFLLSSAALPMVLKPIYGIVSDTVYIRGAHRVPYLAIAGVLQLISWSAVTFSPFATSSAILFTAALTFGNLGAAIADVMNDALVAEVSKKQRGNGKGELQSFAWLIMASGGLLGNLLGGFALKKLELTSMYFIFLILLGLHLVSCFFVNESHFDLAPPSQPSASTTTISPAEDATPISRVWGRRNKADATVMGEQVSSITKPNLLFQLKDQIGLLGNLLKNKEISHTLLWFCASYAMVPVLGSSIFFYQTQVLRIDPTFIGFSRMVGQLGLMVGSQLYGGVLKGLPLRKLLGGVQLLLACCMMSDLLLVKRVNLQLGIPDEFYVLVFSALVDCVSQFKVLPVIVRLGHLCPPGSEGSLMAFFSSCHCLAGLCSGYFGVWLAQHLKISAHSFEGLPLGILIQAMFALLPILFISLVPGESKEKVPEKVQ